jgi:hypothetical protein
MARKRVQHGCKVEYVPLTAVQEQLGLTKGQKIRFKDHHVEEGSSWTQGVLGGESKDGSLTIHTDRGTRSIMPSRCQQEGLSPRGKKIWVDLVPQTA